MVDEEYAKQLEQQRKAFEAQFGSLESMGFEDKTKKYIERESGSDNDNDEQSDNDDQQESDESFEGFSHHEDDASSSEDISGKEASAFTPGRRAPKVIKFQDPSGTYQPPSKQQQRQLRSGKPLREFVQRPEEPSDSDSDTESQNLRKDVELQQFLQESHLLGGVDSYNDVHGKARRRALEMHLTNLSSAGGGSPKLEKVPMQVRKGMVSKHLQRIQKHEHEAADAGIILSKTKKGQFRKLERTYKNDIERRIGTSIKSKDRQWKAHRQRGLKVQTVGRSTRNGLVLSKEEIERIRNR